MLFLRTFGGLCIENGGRPIIGAAGQRRRLILLALLAAAGENGISRESLHALLWPESDFERARKSLNQALFALRHDLKEQNLVTGTANLRLNREVIDSDAGAFVRALNGGDREAAVNLYAGPFLDGISTRSSEDLEKLVERKKQLFTDQYDSALRSLALEAEEKNQFDRAVGYWKKLVASDPLASHATLSLMRAFMRVGDRAAAIRHARVYGVLVRDQLGIDASPEVEKLSALIAAESSRETPSAGIQDAKTSGFPALSSADSSTEVVGTPNHPLLSAEARSVSDNGSAAAQLEPFRKRAVGRAIEASDNLNATRRSEQQSTSNRQLLRLVIVACLAVGATTTVAVGFERVRENRTTHTADTNRVVVIPFQNRTGDPSLNALGSLGADWITDGLARSALIPVVDPVTAAAAIRQVSATSSGMADPLGDIADITGATNVVSGSFYRKGDSLEFYARVADARTGKLLGSIESVAVPTADAGHGIELVRQKVLSLLAELFDARMSQLVMADATPPSFQAYEEFVRGVDHWARDDVTREEQRGYFRRAYALDTTFLTALTFIPSTYDDTKEAKPILDSLESRRDRLTPLDRYTVDYFRADLKGDQPAVLAAAEAASDLAPRSEWSWDAGFRLLCQNRPHAALRYLNRLDPNHGWMRQGWEKYWYAVSQAKHQIGDLEGSRLWLEQARRKFPQDPSIAAAYARALALTGQPDSIRPMVTGILQSDMDWRVFYVYSILADLQRHGRYEEAKAIYQQVVPWYEAKGKTATESDRREFGRILFDMHMETPATAQFRSLLADFPKSDWRTFYIGYLALLAGMRGDSANALRLIDMVPQKEIGNSYVNGSSYWRARVLAQLGRKEEAVRLLQTAFADGRFQRLSLAHSMWYDFPTLQGYAPFETLVASDR